MPRAGLDKEQEATGLSVMAPSSVEQQTPIPLCVDLDGTLVRTDTLMECAISTLRRRPWLLLAFPFWLFRGKAWFKARMAEAGPIAVSRLPYHADFLTFLQGESAKGRRLILATAADQSVARQVAEHLHIFEDVLASDGKTNLKGTAKLAAIRAKLEDQSFGYAGNSEADLAIWGDAAECVMVSAPGRLAAKVRRSGARSVVHEFRSARTSVKTLLRQIRVHQWAKNLLVFLPVLLGHRLRDPRSLIYSTLAFFAFSMVASAIYISNDLVDLEIDRGHERKRTRPLASGDLPIPAGLALVFLLSAAACLIAILLPWGARWALAGYAAANIAYSVKLKRMLLIDVVALALFYTLRVLFGGLATGIPVSIWTLVFSTFIFMSLALAKRLSNLQNRVGRRQSQGRGYLDMDCVMIAGLASASAMMAILVFALYVKSPEVEILYSRPELLLLICPALAYWLGRMLILSNRGYIHDDPLVFALMDRASYVVGAAVAVLMWLAT